MGSGDFASMTRIRAVLQHKGGTKHLVVQAGMYSNLDDIWRRPVHHVRPSFFYI